MTQRTVFEDALLGLLYEAPTHGYDLALHFGTGGDLAAVGRLGKSQLYALLNGLEAEGLARAALQDGGGGPARKVFEVTDEGRERFLRWVRRPVDSIRGLRVEFLLKLYFLARLGIPGQAKLMETQAEVLGRRLAELRTGADDGPGIGPWVRALQEGLLEAGLRWLAEWRDKVPRSELPAGAVEASTASPEPNRLSGRVRAIETHGGIARVDLDSQGGRVAALLTRETLRELALSPGCAVEVVLPPGGVVLERARFQ